MKKFLFFIKIITILGNGGKVFVMDELLKRFSYQLNNYTLKEQKGIYKAYLFANAMHLNQLRKSLDPYIIHPLYVALILMDLNVDADTVKAGLLHDVVEDTAISVGQLEKFFNQDVAFLVDGVSKLPKELFLNATDQKAFAIRKLVEYMQNDFRVISIKLADRLHNMMTLEYMNPEKQKNISLETLEIYAPFAYQIGAYALEYDIEDLSLKYLHSDVYYKLFLEREKLKNSKEFLKIIEKVIMALQKEGISSRVQYAPKHIYGIYKRFMLEEDINNIPDLFSFKIIVNTVNECYQSLDIIKSLFKPVAGYDFDYLKNPKLNLYQSLDTTVIAFDTIFNKN